MSTVKLAGVQSLLLGVFPGSSGRKVEKVCKYLFIKNFEFQVKELDIANVGCVESLKTFKKENSAKRVVYVRSGRSGAGRMYAIGEISQETTVTQTRNDEGMN